MIADPLQLVSSRSWTFVVRGVVALALAIFAFAEPSLMAGALVYIVAAFFIISGLAEFLAGLSLTGVGNWWTLILLGIIQVALGIVMISQPGVGPLALAYLVAIWAIATGLMEISAAIALRNVISNEFWWILLGVITLALGFFIVLRPNIGVFALVYAIGFYAVLAGISLIGVGVRLRSATKYVAKQVASV